jgi:hypothetical protein
VAVVVVVVVVAVEESKNMSCLLCTLLQEGLGF